MEKAYKNLVTIAHGKFNFSNTSGSVYVSAIKSGQPISAAFVMPSSIYKENSNTYNYVPAHTSGKKELGGFATGKTLEIPNGQVIKLVNNCKRHGREYLNACILVLVHEKAGVISIDAMLPQDPKNAVGGLVSVFSGKGVVLSNKDAVDLGYSLQPTFISKYRNSEEIEEGFNITNMSSGMQIEDFTSTVQANGVVNVVAKRVVRKRKIIL